jgi:hypothetical protein
MTNQPYNTTTPPQALPIAPSTGYTSRYDSDVDDVSLTLVDSDDDNYDDSFLGGCTNGMESWITVDESVDSADVDASPTNSAASSRGQRYAPQEEYTKPISIRPSSTLYLPNLPMDTLHRLSSFLTKEELCRLSVTTKRMGERCGEVWKRVRMHVGRCLGEVVLAWVSLVVSMAVVLFYCCFVCCSCL